MNHTAISVHTLGTEPDDMVVAIGVATFDTKNELSRELFIVDLESQPGRYIEPRSMRWWMGQPEESRGVFEQDGEPLDVVMSYIFDIIAKTTGILLIRKDDVAVFNNIHHGFTTSADDIDKIVDCSGIPRDTLVVYPKFHQAALAASADGATLRALWRAQERVRNQDAA